MMDTKLFAWHTLFAKPFLNLGSKRFGSWFIRMVYNAYPPRIRIAHIQSPFLKRTITYYTIRTWGGKLKRSIKKPLTQTRGFLLFLVKHKMYKICHPAAISPFVIIPSNDADQLAPALHGNNRGKGAVHKSREVLPSAIPQN